MCGYAVSQRASLAQKYDTALECEIYQMQSYSDNLAPVQRHVANHTVNPPPYKVNLPLTRQYAELLGSNQHRAGGQAVTMRPSDTEKQGVS